MKHLTHCRLLWIGMVCLLWAGWWAGIACGPGTAAQEGGESAASEQASEVTPNPERPVVTETPTLTDTQDAAVQETTAEHSPGQDVSADSNPPEPIDDAPETSADTHPNADTDTPEQAPPEQAPPDGPTTPACHEIKTFSTGKTPTSIRYVDPKGNDQQGDGSAAKPFLTVGKALQGIKPGMAVRLRPGIHKAFQVNQVKGTMAAPIWIGGAPGQKKPIIQGGSPGIYMSKVAYLVIHDLEITDTTLQGINCDDGGSLAQPTTQYIDFHRLSIHDIAKNATKGYPICIKAAGVYHFSILDSELKHCGDPNPDANWASFGIDLVGCHQGIVARNRIEDHGFTAIQIKGGSKDVLVTRNWLARNGHRSIQLGGNTDLPLFRPPLSKTAKNAEARNLRAIGNVIIDGKAAISFDGCVDCLAANNTILNPTLRILRILPGNTFGGQYPHEQAARGRVFNNIIVFQRKAINEFVNEGPNTQSATFQFRNNLWHASDQPANSKPTLPSPETGGIYGQAPGFVGPNQQNYQLTPKSPANQKGVAYPELTGDYTGACYRRPPSIGAYEQKP